MKLSSFRRIFKQDYSPEIQPDIETLSITLNDSFEEVYNSLNNQLTFEDNIRCTLVTFTATVDSSGKPITPLVLKANGFQDRIVGVIPINAVASNKVDKPQSGLFIDFTVNNNTNSSSNVTNAGNTSGNPLTITINNIKGLPNNVSFTVTAIII